MIDERNGANACDAMSTTGKSALVHLLVNRNDGSDVNTWLCMSRHLSMLMSTPPLAEWHEIELQKLKHCGFGASEKISYDQAGASQLRGTRHPSARANVRTG